MRIDWFGGIIAVVAVLFACYVINKLDAIYKKIDQIDRAVRPRL